MENPEKVSWVFLPSYKIFGNLSGIVVHDSQIGHRELPQQWNLPKRKEKGSIFTALLDNRLALAFGLRETAAAENRALLYKQHHGTRTPHSCT